MKRNIFIICLLLVGYLVGMNLIVIPLYPDQSIYIVKPILWFLMAYFTFILTKDKYVKIKNKNKVLQVCIIIVLFYTIIYYLSGLYFGFIKSAYSSSFFSIIKNIYAFVLIIIAEEYVRYRLLTYGKKKTILFIFVSILFVIVEFNFTTMFAKFTSNAKIFEFVASQLIPLICLNLLYSYLVMVNNYKASIIFRIPTLLLTLVLGIYPDLNWYIYGCLQIIYTALSYYVVRRYLKTEADKEDEDRKNINKVKRNAEYVSWGVFVILMIALVLFISGNLKYVPIAIMSDSMKPVFQRGDVLIYKKVNDFDTLKVGDILVFQHEDKIVTHRIIRIKKEKDFIQINTKGDNLDNEDAFITTGKDIIGVKYSIIPFIGYPSVTLYELLK
ncbi:MAG: signal peptidase I [Bacilli bacterium]